MTISEETEADFLVIAALTRAAFGGEYEVELIQKLRATGLAIVSLVAIEEDSIVGHILFSELAVEVNGRTVKSAALAPLAVLPDRQRQGIGSKLVEAGLQCYAIAATKRSSCLGTQIIIPVLGFHRH